MRFEVRSPTGSLYGSVDVNPRDVASGTVRFAMAKDTRYFGRGYLPGLEEFAQDLSMQVLEMKRSTYVEMPQIGEHGTYRSGRCDWALVWDGPMSTLFSIRTFLQAP